MNETAADGKAQHLLLHCRANMPESGWCCAVTATAPAGTLSFSIPVRHWAYYLVIACTWCRTISVYAWQRCRRTARRAVRQIGPLLRNTTTLVRRIGPLRL